MEKTAAIFGVMTLLLLTGSLAAQIMGKRSWAVRLLFGAGLFLALHAVFRDDYLHLWDERYHALVALHTMDTPFHPRLLPEELMATWPYNEWYHAHTWLHKQPLFTWQMALGMKVFGTSLVGMRSSSVLMFLLLTFAIYKSVKLYFPESAYWVSLMVILSPFLLFLTNGRQAMDHNDIAFFAYIALSFWGFVAYLKARHWRWLLLLGLACGAAMLTKWLSGSLMILVLGLHLLFTKDLSKRSWLGMLLAMAIALIVFLPWQIYAYQQWPSLYLQEMQYNARHIHEVLEGHGQPRWYHVDKWWENFTVITVVFLLSLATIPWFKKANRILLISLLVSILAVILFFTLVQTKLMGYTIILLPLVAFCMAAGLEQLRPKIRYIALAIILLFTGKFMVEDYLQKEQSEEYVFMPKQIRSFATDLRPRLPGNAVIFNTPKMMFVDFMFYTHLSAFEGVPTQAQIDEVLAKDKELYVLILGEPIDSAIAAQVHLIAAPELQWK